MVVIKPYIYLLDLYSFLTIDYSFSHHHEFLNSSPHTHTPARILSLGKVQHLKSCGKLCVLVDTVYAVVDQWWIRPTLSSGMSWSSVLSWAPFHYQLFLVVLDDHVVKMRKVPYRIHQNLTWASRFVESEIKRIHPRLLKYWIQHVSTCFYQSLDHSIDQDFLTKRIQSTKGSSKKDLKKYLNFKRLK